MKKSTAESLMPAFEAVLDSGGTGERAAVEGLRIAGKTGTAQKAEGGSYARGKHRATFVGLFPVEDPQVAIVVVLDEPKTSAYGGVVSAPIFSRIAKRWISATPELARHVASASSHISPTGTDEHEQFATGQTATASTTRFPDAAAVSRTASFDRPAQLITLVSSNPKTDGLDTSCRNAVTQLVAAGRKVRVHGAGTATRLRHRRDVSMLFCE